jgi:hypothetical protein
LTNTTSCVLWKIAHDANYVGAPPHVTNYYQQYKKRLEAHQNWHSETCRCISLLGPSYSGFLERKHRLSSENGNHVLFSRFYGDNKIVSFTAKASSIRLWETKDALFRPLKTIPCSSVVAMSQVNEHKVAVVTQENDESKLQVIHLQSGENVWSAIVQSGKVQALELDDRFVFVEIERQIQVYDANNGELKFNTQAPSVVQFLSCHAYYLMIGVDFDTRLVHFYNEKGQVIPEKSISLITSDSAEPITQLFAHIQYPIVACTYKQENRRYVLRIDLRNGKRTQSSLISTTEECRSIACNEHITVLSLDKSIRIYHGTQFFSSIISRYSFLRIAFSCKSQL